MSLGGIHHKKNLKIQNKYIWDQIKLLLWTLIQPENWALNTHPSLDTQLSLHSLMKDQQGQVILISEGRIFKRTGAIAED